jgi:hypothetical protein
MVLWHHEIPWPVEHNLLFHAFSCYFYVLTWQQYCELIRFRPRRTEVNTLEVDPLTTAACFVDRLKKWSEKVKVNRDQGDTQLRLCEHHVKAWTNNIPGHTRSYKVYTPMILGPAALSLQSHSIPWYQYPSSHGTSIPVPHGIVESFLCTQGTVESRTWMREHVWDCAAFLGASGLSTSSR